MEHAGEGVWRLSLEPDGFGGRMEYRYVLRAEGIDCSREPAFRSIAPAPFARRVFDEWLAPEWPEAAFLRQAFAGTVFRPDPIEAAPTAPPAPGAVHLTLRAPRITPGYRLCVSGSPPCLGQWNPARARIMAGTQYPLWETDLPRENPGSPVEFKFGLWSDREQRLVCFEAGPNRRLDHRAEAGESIVLNCERFQYETPWKGAGVAIPVFSLRSEKGYGIGEFADLEPFAEWAAGCGMRLIQILPVNDTISDFTWKDSYPYKAISAMALHPIYAHIEGLFRDYQLALPNDYLARRAALNRLPQLDYEAVLKDKLAYLRHLYLAVGAQVLASDDFRTFVRDNRRWLKPYAAFCRLRDLYSTPDFNRWCEFAVYREDKIAAWFEPEAAEFSEVMFPCFVQFHLERQLARAIEAGHARGVAFKGDLPIGIDPCSVEAWTEPELFHADRQTGAPPDSFAALGQNWGFPTYHWPRMAEDGYGWWRRRFERMSRCFDALRIDHILGFFRIWEIPRHCAEGILGHFSPALPLSPAEIRRAGFSGDPASFAAPAVAETSLPAFFGEHAAQATSHLLTRDSDGFFRIRAPFDQAAARQSWYAADCSPEEAKAVEDGIRRIGFEVLFLEDPDHPGHYHPRVSLNNTELFQSLNPQDRAALQQLHDDFFYRRHNRFWEAEALRKLPALLDSTQMLICGEDLGMIPASVPGVLSRLGILSLEVQRMPKNPYQSFGTPLRYPYLSVCTTSTHDMPTLRGWWEEDADSRQRFHKEVMRKPGEAPRDATPEVCRFMVAQHLAAASMWCILPWQDWLALDPQLRHPRPAEERINVPAIPRYYWRYRMHLPIETLLGAADFNRTLSRMITDAGRNPIF
jgi:4-alpha-glucanotransferase